MSWPVSYGFQIYGNGPSFIVSVQDGSVADKSGLRPGDQILQVDENEVSSCSAEQLIELVAQSPDIVPSLGVASRLKEVILSSSSSKTPQFGLSLKGPFPVIIDEVNSKSPAFYTNLKSGDVLIKIDKKTVTSLSQARELLAECCRVGGAQVAVISGPAPARSVPQLQPVKQQKDDDAEKVVCVANDSSASSPCSKGQQKARTFLLKVKNALGGKHTEMQKFVGSVQNYSLSSDIEQFVIEMNDLLKHSQDYEDLLGTLKFFIPSQHKKIYEDAIRFYNTEDHYGSFCSSTCSSMLSSGRSDVSLQHDENINSYVERVRTVTIRRCGQSFGLTLRGQDPVEIESVDSGSPSEKAGLKEGERILSINGISLRSVSHSKAVALIQGSGSMPTLLLQSTSGALPQPVTQGLPSFRSSTYMKSKPDKETYDLTRAVQSTEVLDPFHWASEYIPDHIKIQGCTFKQQLKSVLDLDEARTIKNALSEFYCTRQLEALLFHLYPILHGPDTRRNLIWHYILICLTEHEREFLKKKLLDLNQNLPAEKDSNTSQKWRMTTQSHGVKSKGEKQPVAMPSKEPMSSSAKNALPSGNSTNLQHHADCAVYAEVNKHRPDDHSNSTKRHRRRRTVENVDYTTSINPTSSSQSPVDHDEHVISHQSKSASDVPSSGLSTPNTNDFDSGFCDAQQQMARRRRRELSGTLRRQRSAGVLSPTLTDESHCDSNATGCHGTAHSCATPTEFQRNGEQLFSTTTTGRRRRGSRNRSLRNTVEICTTTTTTEETTFLIDQTGRRLAGDRDKKGASVKKKSALVTEAPVSPKSDIVVEAQPEKSPQATQPPQPIPISSVDDIIFEEYLPPKRTASEHTDLLSTESTKRNNNLNHDDDSTMRIEDSRGSATVTDGQVLDRLNSESRDKLTNLPKRKEASEMAAQDFSNFNDFSYDDSKKKGYLSSLKRKLTFSRPPKNADTDTFLTELSAQFDEEMHLVEDLKIEDEEKDKVKYGEKWSYTPIAEISNEREEASQTRIDEAAQSRLPASLPPPEETPPNPTIQEPAPVENATGDRQRVRRRRRRVVDNARPRAETAASVYMPNIEVEQEKRLSDPLIEQRATVDVAPQEEEVVYDVPKPVTQQRRAHINVQRRTRRSRGARPVSMSSKRSSTELRMNVWMKDDKEDPRELNSIIEDVKLRNHSPTEQTSFFDRAKKKNYRVSGISVDMEHIFSEAEEDLHRRDFKHKSNGLHLSHTELADPDEVYAPLQEEALALGLAYDEYEQEEEEETEPHTSSVGTTTAEPNGVPPPPPLPSAIPIPPPIPPPPPLSPPLEFKNTPPTSPVRLSVKRINWEKIEPVDLGNTVWGQLGEDHETINDVVKYLDLEEHFATKQHTKIKKKVQPAKTTSVALMSHKKAYNTSILLAHLKMTKNEIYNCLLINSPETARRRMDASHYKQLLLYVPDKDETEKLRSYSGDVVKLNEADQLFRKLISVPGLKLRLKSLLFKHSFAEKEEEIRNNLEVVQRASNQLRKSRKLAKILEFVLAMGNYMNRGHKRVSKATGFRIHFLAEMDCTKTSDNKLTFLHILARAVLSKFPEVITFADELEDVNGASRIVYPAVLEELQELRKTWLDIRDHLHVTASKLKNDRFKISMETCLVRTNAALKRLEQLHHATVKEFNKVAQYFGENPKNIGMQQFFNIFDKFIHKFQKSSTDIKKVIKHKQSAGPR